MHSTTAGRRAFHGITVLLAVVGIVVTGGLVWLSAVVSDHTQRHLLGLQVDQAGIILGEVVPTIRTPLASTVAVADATGGNASKVVSFVGRDVGTAKGTPFVSLSLWQLGAAGPHRLLSLGAPAELGKRPAKLEQFLSTAPPGRLEVTGLMPGPAPRIGYTVVSAASPAYAVYAETRIPADRRAKPPSTSAFNDLNFALYLGTSARRADLVEATVPTPLPGPTASTTIPFGSAHLEFVASPTKPLGGGLLPALPWIIAVAGALLTVAGIVLSERLTRRRRVAEGLAAENHRLYAEQRTIAQSLQTALLPQELPIVDGVDVSVRYVPGDERIDIGGDWYDVIRCDDHTFVFVVGDVSGRGLPAAKTMASLHYAIRAYAAQGDDPPTIVGKLGNLLDVGRDGQFATVLLGHADVPRHELTVVNAGHLPPLVVTGTDAHFIDTTTCAPIGVAAGSYRTSTVRVPPRGSVIAYTDGLVERRGEILDVGLDRLRRVAAAHDGPPGALLDAVVTELTADRPSDDIALMELRWKN